MSHEDSSMEWLEVVDENDVVVGMERRGAIHAKALMHRSAQVLVFNSAGELFLQKRSAYKDEFPGLWDSSAAGHVNPKETYEQCARRELAEELGIDEAPELEPLFRIPASETTGWEHCSVFRCRWDGPLQLQVKEVDEGRWLSPAEMDRLVDDTGTPLTPAIRRIWRRLRTTRLNGKESPMQTTRLLIATGALFCMAGVITGAFGAHALEQQVPPERLQTWGKGVDYLFVHALGLILLGILEALGPKKCHRVAGVLMVAGILLFSGSLFVLVLSGIRWLGMITPLGGVSFVSAWLVLGGCYLVRSKNGI